MKQETSERFRVEFHVWNGASYEYEFVHAVRSVQLPAVTTQKLCKTLFKSAKTSWEYALTGFGKDATLSGHDRPTFCIGFSVF